MEKINNELQIEQDVDFQRKNWKFERAGWLFMLLFVLAAVAGLFGRGGVIWNTSVAGDKNDGLEIKYSSFVRQQAPEELEINMGGTETTLVVQSKDFNKIQINNVVPQPEKTESSADKITYTFPPQQTDRSVNISYKAKEVGSAAFEISNGLGKKYSINQFIYP